MSALVRASAVVTLRELGRRRMALLFVFTLPLAFYLLRLDVPWQALRFLAIGVGWAVATLALFVQVGARRLDERLCVVGAAPTAVFVGRQLALMGVGLVIAGVYFVLVAVTLDVSRLPAVGLLLVTTALLAVPLGALVSLAVPRELEGALALLSIMAVQFLADPSTTAARALPMWSTRELGAYAIEPVGAVYLQRGLVHVAITITTCGVIAWAVNVVRLRPVRLGEPGLD